MRIRTGACTSLGVKPSGYAAGLGRVQGLALEGEGSAARDDEAAGQRARQIRRQALGDAVGEIIVVRVAAEIGEGQHDHGKTRRRERVLCRAVAQHRRTSRRSCELLLFLHCANEAEAFARQGLDQALLVTVVTDCGPSGI